MPSDYSAGPSTSRGYNTDDDYTPAPGFTDSQTGQAALEEKQSLIDELLPVPVTEQVKSASSSTSVQSAIRRICSLGVIIVFLLTITFYGTALIGQAGETAGMKSAGKSVVGGLVDSVGGSLKGVQDVVSEGMEQLGLGDEDEDTTPVETGVWDNAPISEILPQSMEGTTNNGLTTASRTLLSPFFVIYTYH